MRRWTTSGLALVLAAFAACSPAARQPPMQPAPAVTMGGGPRQPGEMMGMTERCPAAVPGTRVTASDLPDGAALEFTTAGDLDELRRRVRTMAAMHTRHHGMAPPGATAMPASVTQVENIERGARILFTAADPAHVDALRAAIHEHSARMQSGECPAMLMGVPRGPHHGPASQP